MIRRNRRDINNFVRDAGDAAKIAGSHVPGVKHIIEGYEIANTVHRLSRSTPKAARAVGRELTNRVIGKPQRSVRNLKRRFGIR